MKFTGLLASLLLLHPTLGSDAYEVFESLARIPKGWVEHEVPAAEDVINLKIHLKQQNVEAFEQKLIDVRWLQIQI
jgi:hypothetical protein